MFVTKKTVMPNDRPLVGPHFLVQPMVGLLLWWSLDKGRGRRRRRRAESDSSRVREDLLPKLYAPLSLEVNPELLISQIGDRVKNTTAKASKK